MNIGNVLSLFDGISCGQIALNRAGFTYDNYFASEIDKHAIKVTQTNYPNTIQLGDVTKISSNSLPEINILIGGSPCQGFSFAGKQLNFEDPRSKLFFEYVRLLKECQPKYFLLENVKMKQEYQDVISKYLRCQPIKINSATVSAQSRIRLYWTNIPNINYPQNKNIQLKDILQIKENSIGANKNIKNESNCLTSVLEDSLVYIQKPIKLGEVKNGGQGNRIYSIEGKGITLSANSGGMAGSGNMLINDNSYVRKLTPVECERLQTVPDNYTSCISDSKRYKCLGNGWTVDVISHIISFIKTNSDL